MPNPVTNFFDSFNTDLGNKLITKEYLMSVYPQIANQLITPELWVWGSNNFGQLGDNTTVNRSIPVTTFSGGANWKQVSSGGNSQGTVAGGASAAVKTDGTLWTWGRNLAGNIGDNTLATKTTPVTTFSGGINWKQVSVNGGPTSGASGGDLLCAAIKTDGTLWTWGSNTGGITSGGGIGDNTTTNRCTPVTTFAGGINWKQVSVCATGTVAAVKTDGTLWTWGTTTSGQGGINVTGAGFRRTPVTTFAGGTNWKQVAGGLNYFAAIKTDGTLWTWGGNTFGQLGDNTIIDRCTPVTTFAGGTNWKQVSCGGSNIAAIKTDGTLWVWGAGIMVGDNTAINRSTPVTTFAGGTNWKQVSCGFSVTAAIKTDGTLWTWGLNGSGQLGTNDTITRSTPVTTFAGGTNWKQVACGYLTVTAIKTSDDLQGI